MIDLTPLEVRKKKADFKRGLRGYETAEVDTFLDLVADRLEEVVRQNTNLQDRVSHLTEAVEGFRTREQAMNEALVSAQELREEIRGQAEKASEMALSDAKAAGERLVADARKEVEHYKEAAQQLVDKRDRFVRNYRNFLESQLAELGREEERIVRARAGELSGGEDEAIDH